MSINRIIGPTAFALLLLMLFAPNIQAQRCGGGFARIIVSDAEGNSISRVTIELVAEISYGDFRDLRNDTDTKQIPAGTAEEFITRSGLMDRSEDISCRNPLKQVANSTKVKHPGNGTSRKNFGYCTSEGHTRLYLLKISAPGYVTSYHVGYFLGGCSRSHKFVLSQKVEVKK